MTTEAEAWRCCCNLTTCLAMLFPDWVPESHLGMKQVVLNIAREYSSGELWSVSSKCWPNHSLPLWADPYVNFVHTWGMPLALSTIPLYTTSCLHYMFNVASFPGSYGRRKQSGIDCMYMCSWLPVHVRLFLDKPCWPTQYVWYIFISSVL